MHINKCISKHFLENLSPCTYNHMHPPPYWINLISASMMATNFIFTLPCSVFYVLLNCGIKNDVHSRDLNF